jgi:hypothetical protein
LLERNWAISLHSTFKPIKIASENPINFLVGVNPHILWTGLKGVSLV